MQIFTYISQTVALLPDLAKEAFLFSQSVSMEMKDNRYCDDVMMASLPSPSFSPSFSPYLHHHHSAHDSEGIQFRKALRVVSFPCIAILTLGSDGVLNPLSVMTMRFTPDLLLSHLMQVCVGLCVWDCVCGIVVCDCGDVM